MKQTITPERLLGEYIGELNGICAWDIPEQLREKLGRRAKELQELQIEMDDQHKYKDTDLQEIKGEHPVMVNVDAFNNSGMSIQDLIDEMKSAPLFHVPNPPQPSITSLETEDVFDITTMD